LQVEEGLPAPDFTLTADDGSAVSLSALKGEPVVIYFYPKDDSLPPFDSMSE
jgi:peroxiredoxin Q/BCP